jgi:TolB-like protein
VQLIDAIGGGHLWAERFDRSLDDVFKVHTAAGTEQTEEYRGL